MKKALLVFMMAALGVICFGTMAMASDLGFDLYLDYAQLSADDVDVDLATIGMDYARNGLLLGGYYSFSTSVDYGMLDEIEAAFNDISFDESVSQCLIYGGYDFMKDDNYVLGVVASYMSMSEEVSARYQGVEYGLGDVDITSVGLGFEAAGKFNAFSASLLYLYGIDNKIDVGGEDDDDFDFNILQIKGTYNFTDSFGMSLVYRCFDMEDDNLDGIGIGVDFKF